ncbi:MAG: protein-L-isoaspartate O-methyltransferase [Hyphomicrobiaceae bacterium]|nr:protein-L-isoaspartate O-methyltransferase [Hyphomicrobiaceae bacterium]
MVDYAIARTKMVDNQLRTNDVTDHAIIDALLEVPRELFVPEAQKPLAYIDEDLPLGSGDRYLMKPHVFGKLMQAAEIKPTDRVLIVGAGTGYSAAVMSRFTTNVVALESDATLAATARALLANVAAANIAVETGSLLAGCPAKGPYDVILVEGAIESIPPSLTAQLREGGRLIAIEGTGRAGRAMILNRVGADVSGRLAFNAAAKPLPGFAKPREFVF